MVLRGQIPSKKQMYQSRIFLCMGASTTAFRGPKVILRFLLLYFKMGKRWGGRKTILPTSKSLSYEGWTREQLLERIRHLENSGLEGIPPTPGKLVKCVSDPKRKIKKGMDFEAYPRHHVALKIAYFGWNYNGFTSQRSYKGILQDFNDFNDTSNAEVLPINSNLSVKNDKQIINNISDSIDANIVHNYSDRQAPTGETLSFEEDNFKDGACLTDDMNKNTGKKLPKKDTCGTVNRNGKLVVAVEDLLFDALMRTRLIESPRSCRFSRCGRTDTGVSSTGQVVALTLRTSNRKIDPQDKDSEDNFDLPICTMLNKNLPPDIRVIGVAPVDSKFDARFSCKGRIYKYFFPPNGLNIDLMREAAFKLIGTHDFRNFGRRDPSNTTNVFIRNIKYIKINPVDNDPLMWYFEIKGSSFLYHQVRCTMEVLMLIGRGVEPISVIDYMLDVEKCVKIPTYDIADECPLVLVECDYGEQQPIFNLDGKERLHCDLFDLWRTCSVKKHAVEMLVARDILSSKSLNPYLSSVSTPRIIPRHHRPAK